MYKTIFTTGSKIANIYQKITNQSFNPLENKKMYEEAGFQIFIHKKTYLLLFCNSI